MLNLDAVRKQRQFEYLNFCLGGGKNRGTRAVPGEERIVTLQLGEGYAWSFWLHSVFAFICVQTCWSSIVFALSCDSHRESLSDVNVCEFVYISQGVPVPS